jgi:hypothetical protein
MMWQRNKHWPLTLLATAALLLVQGGSVRAGFLVRQKTTGRHGESVTDTSAFLDTPPHGFQMERGGDDRVLTDADDHFTLHAIPGLLTGFHTSAGKWVIKLVFPAQEFDQDGGRRPADGRHRLLGLTFVYLWAGELPKETPWPISSSPSHELSRLTVLAFDTLPPPRLAGDSLGTPGDNCDTNNPPPVVPLVEEVPEPPSAALVLAAMPALLLSYWLRRRTTTEARPE